MKILIIMILFVVELFATPEWYINVPKNRYPTEQYFIGVYKSDKSFDDAKKSAIRELTKQISVSTKSKESFSKNSRTENGEEKISSEYSARTMIFSDLTLNNVKVGEKKKEGSSYYILMYLKKQDLIDKLRNNIKVANKSLENLLKNSTNGLKSGAITTVVNNLSKANDIIYKTKESINILSGLDKLRSDDMLLVSNEDIESIFNKLASNIEITKKSGDNQEVLIGKTSGPFVVHVSDKSGRPLVGVTIGFYYDDELVSSVLTDNNGDGSVVIKPKNVDVNTVVAKMIFDSPYSFVQRFSNRVSTTFLFKPYKKEYQVKINILNKSPLIKVALVDKLSEVGIVNGDNAKKLLDVFVASKTLKDITSLKRIVIKKVDVTFVIKQGLKAPKKVVLTSKGSGTSDELAIKNGIKSLEFSEEFYSNLGIDQKIEKNPVVAIVDNNKNNVYYSLGINKAFKLSVENSFINSGLFDVVEREQLNQVLSEMKLQQSGLVKDDQIKEFGNLLGVDYIALCSVVPFSSEYLYQIKLVDVKTGKIVKSTQTKSNGTVINGIVNQLMQKIIY